MPTRDDVMESAWMLAPLAGGAFLAWFVFHPGLFSPDSIDQLVQATRWSFDDWHPPFLGIMAGAFLRLGGSVPALILFQALGWACASGIAVFAAARTTGPVAARGGAADPGTPSALRRSPAALFAGSLILAAWAILPPWPFHAVTFWKDSWTAVGVLAMAAGLRLGGNGKGGAALLVLGGASLAALSRHNAAILLPIAGLGLSLMGTRLAAGVAATRARVPLVVVAFLVPALVALGVNRALPHLAPVTSSPIGTVLMAHELGIAIHARPGLEARLPYAARAVADRYPVETARGDLGALVAHTWWLGPNLGRTLDGPRIAAEYRALLLEEPMLVAELKLRSWINLLNIRGQGFWIQEIIEPNELGIEPTPGRERARLAWIGAARVLHAWLPSRSILASHAPWILAGLALFALSLGRMARLRARDPRGPAGADARRSAVMTVLADAVPLAYAAGFLAAYTVPDYRYLYPATLAIQAAIIGRLVARRK